MSQIGAPPAPTVVPLRTLMGVGLALLLSLITAAHAPAQTSTGEWSTVWYVRLTYEAAPGLWSQTGIEPVNYTSRASAVQLRADILANGWSRPPLMPGEPDLNLRGEVRVAPGAMRYAGVKRMLCRLDLPPQERPPCQYPDGDPPGEP